VDAGRIGLLVFLISIGVLFAATLVAVLVVRFVPSAGERWQGVPLPWELLLSTAILILSSVTCEQGLRRIRRGDRRGLNRSITTTLLLGLLFVVLQAWSWLGVLEAMGWETALEGRTSLLAAWIFVVLTLVHALHVLGGIVPLAIVRRRSAAGRYTASRHGGVEFVRSYWHFLGAVWLLLLATLVAVVPASGG